MNRSNPATGPQPRHSLLWPSLIAGLLMAIPLGLGIWQLERLAWKTDLIQVTEGQIAQPPVPLPADLSDPAALDFRRVTADGRLVGDRILYYTAGSPTGRAGLRALAPLQLADREFPLLVDLGWLPLDRKGAPLDLPSAEIHLEGVLRAPELPGWLTPGNDPAANVWKWLDLPAMAAALGVPTLEPVVLRTERIEPADATPALASLERGPITGALRNEHLHYAITWFALAAGMAVVYLLFVRRHLREQGTP